MSKSRLGCVILHLLVTGEGDKQVPEIEINCYGLSKPDVIGILTKALESLQEPQIQVARELPATARPQ